VYRLAARFSLERCITAVGIEDSRQLRRLPTQTPRVGMQDDLHDATGCGTRALYGAGATFAEIGRECACDWRTVRKYLAEDAISVPPAGRLGPASSLC
jgi:hypothetical protein